MENQKRKRHPFTPNEDKKLRELVKRFGEQNWGLISIQMENRSIRQCRDRWMNSLCENVVKSKWTVEEDALLMKLFKEQGSRWKSMEKYFPGRAQYDIRNHCKSIFNQKLYAVSLFNKNKLFSNFYPKKPSQNFINQTAVQSQNQQDFFNQPLIQNLQPSVILKSPFQQNNNNNSIECETHPNNSLPMPSILNSDVSSCINDQVKPFINLDKIDPILVPFISSQMFIGISSS